MAGARIGVWHVQGEEGGGSTIPGVVRMIVQKIHKGRQEKHFRKVIECVGNVDPWVQRLDTHTTHTHIHMHMHVY
jgi:hypothetical protein